MASPPLFPEKKKRVKKVKLIAPTAADVAKEWQHWLEFLYYTQKMDRDIQPLLDRAYWIKLGRIR